MAVITKQEMAVYEKAGLIEYSDFKALAEISRKKKLKRGETGFSPEQMKNFAVRESTCSPQVKQVILDYFEKKVADLKRLAESL